MEISREMIIAVVLGMAVYEGMFKLQSILRELNNRLFNYLWERHRLKRFLRATIKGGRTTLDCSLHDPLRMNGGIKWRIIENGKIKVPPGLTANRMRALYFHMADTHPIKPTKIDRISK